MIVHSEIPVKVIVDTENFVEAVVRTSHATLIFDVKLEVIGLTVDETYARFYTRGAFDPDFATPDGRDNYLKVLCRIYGDRGHAARAGFLRGWVEQHTTGDIA